MLNYRENKRTYPNQNQGTPKKRNFQRSTSAVQCIELYMIGCATAPPGGLLFLTMSPNRGCFLKQIMYSGCSDVATTPRSSAATIDSHYYQGCPQGGIYSPLCSPLCIPQIYIIHKKSSTRGGASQGGWVMHWRNWTTHSGYHEACTV